MQIIFRKPETSDMPAADELLINPRGAEPVANGFAELAFDKGVAAFPQGAGPIRTLVVDHDPTFDDMLAALFVEERLEGRELPRGAQSFAHYARRRREGRTPSSLPLEVSMEGIYLAIRNASDGDLTKPQTAAKFLRDWRRMANVILKAAAAGQNPFNTPLFSDGDEFADERASLAADRAVFHQDVLRGEQWIVDIPGAPRRSRALFLRKPTSLLFPQWSRREGDCGAERPYIFLAVDWGKGCWMFSTDPEQRLRLDSLAEVLQQAEAATDPASAAEKPWETRFDDTLVAHRHTKMSNEKVLSVVKRWAHARRPPSPKPIPAWVAAAAVVLFGIVSWAIGLSGGIHVRQATVQEETAVAKNLPNGPSGSDATLRTALKEHQDSIYLVLQPDKHGVLQPAATAWVVDQAKGILVTNAHVVETCNTIGAGGGPLVVRSRGNQRGQFVVTNTKIHPGYLDWCRLWREAVARSPGSDTEATTEPPVNFCDVALLYVDHTQGLGAALTLADDPTLQRLSKPDLIGFVGYLIDNRSDPGLNAQSPDPAAETGDIAAMTDYFGNPSIGDPAQQLLIQHNIPTSGGASGSPIFNTDGNVVGVHSSGDYIFIPGWSGRIPAGLHYAQRADLVEELLGNDDRAAEVQKHRTELWKDELNNNKDAAQFLELISDWKASVDKQFGASDSRAPTAAVDLVSIAAKLSERQQSESAGTGESYRSTLSFTVDGSGALIVAAYTASAPWLDMTVYPVKDGARQAALPTLFDGKQSHPYVRADVEGTQLFEVQLTGGKNADYSLRASMVQLTLQQKRQALASDWIAHGSAGNTAQVEPVQVLDLPGETAENSGRFLSTIDITGLSGDPMAGGEYFAVANSANGENLQVYVTVAAAESPAAPSKDDALSPLPHRSFTAKNGDRVQVTVVGPAAGIKFDVVIYAAVPKPAAK
jgi:hypothetical protein